MASRSRWFQKALGYLTDAAKAGDYLALSSAGMMLLQVPGREYEALEYRVATLEARKRAYPSEVEMLDGKILEVTKVATQKYNLQPELVQKATNAGRVLAKTATLPNFGK